MESKMTVAKNVKSASIGAVITRADGTVENLGVVAYYHRNPLRMLWWHMKRFFTRSMLCKPSTQ